MHVHLHERRGRRSIPNEKSHMGTHGRGWGPNPYQIQPFTLKLSTSNINWSILPHTEPVSSTSLVHGPLIVSYCFRNRNRAVYQVSPVQSNYGCCPKICLYLALCKHFLFAVSLLQYALIFWPTSVSLSTNSQRLPNQPPCVANPIACMQDARTARLKRWRAEDLGDRRLKVDVVIPASFQRSFTPADWNGTVSWSKVEDQWENLSLPHERRGCLQ